MEKIGIDVSKSKIDCAWLRDATLIKVKTKVFENNVNAFQSLIDWAVNNAKQSPDRLHFIMEATSVYHEALAYYLHEAGCQVSVVNPHQSKKFAESLGKRSKTDKKDSVVLARLGASRTLTAWQPEAEEIRGLKALILRIEAIEKDIHRENNRLEKAEISPGSLKVVESIHRILSDLTQEKKRVEALIKDHFDQHPRLKKDKKLLESIPGVGEVISQYMVALIRSRSFTSAKQCGAFVGLNPILCESGKSLQKRPRLSKAGDGRLRAKLYMPAVVATRHNPDIKKQYERLLRNGKSKMSAIGAAMRKLVQICYGVLKHQKQYQPQAI